MTTLLVCTSHVLTPEQLEGWDKVIYVSKETNDLTRQIPANASLQDVKALSNKVLAEASDANTTHFFCVGEPTLTLHANLLANNVGFTCVQSTTERKSVDQVQPDGTIHKTAVFKHVQ